MGRFSSDRTIQEYAEQIWHIEPHMLPPIVPPNAGAQQTQFGQQGSVGSLRRHHQMSFDERGNVGSITKGSFGSLRGRNQPMRVPPQPQIVPSDSDDEGEKIEL